MTHITVFDFDGTLTRKDSMLEIIIYKCGRWGLAWALIRQIHLIILMMMGLYSNQKCKERLLAHCFGGMKVEDFEEMCQKFADSHRDIIRPETLQKMKVAEHPVVISASPERWVSKFVPGVMVLSSQMEVVDGRITGKLVGSNCYGPEKVNRLLVAFPDLLTARSEFYVIAYGDSRGDREMLAFSDEGYMVTKNGNFREK